ncbi:hypothetical protein FACS189414_0520 [Bacteroidia bacterium]|nr:hypothetical protein FACS189414_0520 [Bacteroidia bacterium]
MGNSTGYTYSLIYNKSTDMKTYFKQLINVSLILAGFLVIIFSCTIEDNKDPSESKYPIGDGNVSFSLKLPNNSTRSLTLADENELKDVKVLVFNQNGTLQYAADAFLADPISSDITVKKYSAKLSATPNGEKIDLMVIANAGSIIAAKYPNGLPLNQGMTKDNLAQALTLEKANGWASQKDAQGYMPIPMWGWVSGASIHSETGLDANHSTIALTRMLAKINIGITGNAQTVFKLSAVYLMNRNTVGRVIPNITQKDPWTGTAPKATVPSLPTDPKPQKGAGNYLLYGGGNLTDASSSFEMKGVVYSFEAEKGVAYSATKEYEESPCLIIGGKYMESQTVTYYRVDFVKNGSDGSPAYLHVLRNYLYDVSISQVTGPGYPTVEDALKGRPVNIIGDVVPWIDSDMPIQVSDGIHVLSVDKDLLQFYATGESQVIRVYTDVSDGWRINTANLPSWLQFISPVPDTAGLVKGETLKYIDLTLKTDELAGTATPRETVFTVEAGALKKDITIKQTKESVVNVEATPNMIVFPLSAPEAKIIKVTSLPANAVRFVSHAKTGTIAFLPGKGPADYNGTSATEFVIQPTPGTSGTVFMTIRVSNEQGVSATQAIYIVQLPTDSNYGVIGLPEQGYEAADMGVKSFQVISSVPWKFTMHENPPNFPNPGSMITLTDNTEHPAQPDALVDYSFILDQNPGYAERIAQLGVMSSTPDWMYFTQPIRQKGTPPYLLITNPDPKQHDFSISEGDFKVSFTTNAGWKFYGDENFSKIVATTDSLHDHVYTGSNNGLNSVSRTVTFTPVQIAGDTSIAGTALATVVKFETANHPGTPSTHEFVLHHATTERWDGVFYSFDPVSDTLTITAYTNGAWAVKSTNGLGDTVVAAAPYGPHTVYYKLPGFDVFAAENFHFSAWPSANPSAHKDTIVPRPESTLTFTGFEGFPTILSGEKVPAKGVDMDKSNYYLNFEGTYTGNFSIRVIRNGTTRGTVVAGKDKHRRMSIRPVDSWEDCTLNFEFQHGPQMAYKMIPALQFIQASYSIHGQTERDDLAPSGGMVTEYVGGFFPRMQVYADIDGEVISPQTIAPGDTAEANISVPAINSWDAPRTVQFKARDLNDPTKVFSLSSLEQNKFNITPISFRSKQFQGGTYELEKTFTGDFPRMIVESEKPSVAKPEYPEYPAGKSLNLRIEVMPNNGPRRTVELYLKDRDTQKIRATVYIEQEGIDSEYVIIGPFTDCVQWVSTKMQEDYIIINPAESDLDGEDLRSICATQGSPHARYFAVSNPVPAEGGGVYHGVFLTEDDKIEDHPTTYCSIGHPVYVVLKRK